MIIWKTLLTDFNFWVLSLYVWAGVLLVVPSFVSVPPQHGRNISLAVTLMYMFCTVRYLFRYPFLKWASQISLEGKVGTFKETLLSVATKRLVGENEVKAEVSSHAIYKAYVYDILFQTDDVFEEDSANFLKSDLEFLLLSDMGHIVSGPLIEYIWSAIDDDSDGTIEPAEFYSFLINDAKPPTKPQRALSIVLGMVMDKSWSTCSLFFLSGCVGFFVNVLPRYGHEINFGPMSPSTFNAYLYLIGTLYFSFASFDAIRDSYNLQQTAKKMIAKWIAAMDESMESARNLSSNMIISKFHSNGGLSKSELNRLLENSSLYLPKVEFNNIFEEIDYDNNETVSRDEIEEYVNRKVESKTVAVLIRCLKSFDFWAQSTWFIGSINYVVASYGYWKTWNYRVRSISIAVFFSLVDSFLFASLLTHFLLILLFLFNIHYMISWEQSFTWLEE